MLSVLRVLVVQFHQREPYGLDLVVFVALDPVPGANRPVPVARPVLFLDRKRVRGRHDVVEHRQDLLVGELDASGAAEVGRRSTVGAFLAPVRVGRVARIGVRPQWADHPAATVRFREPPVDVGVAAEGFRDGVVDHVPASESKVLQSLRVPEAFRNRSVQVICRNVEPRQIRKPTESRRNRSGQMVQFDVKDLECSNIS
mmetsp:Transcript_3341/g.8916  ORF Transcript_3341/g.8916 Transcript_3341/m.8916 type:complete len:200 (-) Transcript_3341:692-1291(-)